LALVPFILLRAKWVSQIYYLLSSVCLAFLAYDYFVPFRYFSPSFRGRMLRGELSNGELLRINEWSQFSTSGNDSEISFWISNPTVPGPMEILQGLMYVSPLALALLYRRYYPRWASSSAGC